MYIAIINWSAGENDPFSVFSERMGQMFQALGRDVIYLKFDEDFADRLQELRQLNIDFAVTWQGLASQLKLSSTGENLWDVLQVPLYCLHGDHPCLMMSNHAADADYVYHHYLVSTFNQYANRYIPRKNAAQLVQLPLFFADLSHLPIEGDYFVIPKNHDDTEAIRHSFSQIQQPAVRSFLQTAATLIEESLRSNRRTDHHALIDELIYEGSLLGALLESLGEHAMDLIHDLHKLLEKLYRNLLAEIALEELHDLPVKVLGRGWERYAGQNPKHVFTSFNKVADGDFQFRSRYGIVDVCPAYDALHDRTWRALSSRSSVLVGSSWPLADNFPDARDALFYSGLAGDLREKAERVVADPKAHRERCAEFARDYRLWASDHQFLQHFERLTLHARRR